MDTQIENTPVLGGTAPRQAQRTAQKLAGFALRSLGSIQFAPRLERYLDVGCGNGFITEFVAPAFNEVVGIDVEERRGAEQGQRLDHAAAGAQHLVTLIGDDHAGPRARRDMIDDLVGQIVHIDDGFANAKQTFLPFGVAV